MTTNPILQYQVAGVSFCIHFEDYAEGRALLPSYEPFLVEQTDAPRIFTLTINKDAVDLNEAGKEIGRFENPNSRHDVYLLPDGGYKMIVSNFRKEPAAAFVTNADFSSIKVSLFGNKRNWFFGLNNAIMIAFAFSGAQKDLLLIHASVTMKDGKGYLFLGKSGTGKSTHSQLWLKHIPGTELLNDDNPAVRLINDEVIVYGTPWSGKTPCYKNKQVPIGAFVKLEQYPENIIRREPPLKAFATLLTSTSSMLWDKPLYEKICNTVSAIAMRAPLFHLRCKPDEEAARLSFTNVTKV